MRVCFIGNSHLASVRAAWPAFSEANPQASGAFFGASGGRMRFLKIDGRALVAAHPRVANQMKMVSGGEARIDIDRYDRIVLVGLSIGLYDMLRIGAQHRTVSTTGKAEVENLVSDAAFDLSMRRFFEWTPAHRIVDMIRAISKTVSIAISPTPLPCRALIEGATDYIADLEVLAERLEPVWRKSFADLVARQGLNLHEQPEETKESRFFTKPDYAEGAARLRRSVDFTRRQADQRHMNANFGALVLRDTLAGVGSTGAQPRNLTVIEGGAPGAYRGHAR